MRLTDLFEQVILEAPEEEVANNRRTVTFAASDVYMMSMLPIPKRLDNKTGKMVADANDFEQRTYIVGTEPGMVDPKFAAGISQWKKDGSIPGSIRDMETGELVPYDSNSYLADVGRTIAGAAIELGANLTRFGATGLDYVVRGNQQATDLVLTKFGFPDVIDSDGPMQFPYTKAATGTKENPMWLDAWSNAVNDTRDLKYQDEEDMTANAVQGFGDLAGLFIGNSGATWGGAFSLLAGELPSEIVDVALLAGTSWWTGGALNVAFNASEAGGAAAIEIQRKIEAAYEEGTLQKTAHWDMNMQAAKDMIEAEGTVYESDQEYNDAVEKLAMDQTIYASYQNGLLKVAMTAGVLDSVADRLMIRPPVPSKYVKNAVLKKIIAGTDKTKAFTKGAVTEAGQEGLEQILINLAVIHGTGDKQVSSTYEGVINAMYNSVYGTAASGVVQGGVTTANLGSKGTKATYAQLRRFFAGEGTVEDLFRFAKDGDIEALKAAVRNNDPNSDKFGQLDFVGALKRRDKNFVTVDDLSKKDKQKFLDGTLTRKDKRDGLKINGKRYDIALLESNTKDAELMSMFQNSIDMRAEGKIQSTLENEEQVKYVAQRLGIYVKGDDINTMMAKLEDITKMDIRIAGSSTLEAPLWSELTPQQKRQFVTDGEIRFSNDPERGNQIWSRDKVLYTSRINGETLPSEVQNLADNVEARPTATNNDVQLGMENDIVRNAEATAFQDFTDEQQMWDEEFGATHNPDGSPKDPNAQGDAGRQLTADDTTDELQGRRPDKNMEHYQQIAQNKLLSNNDYRNAKKRLEDQKERFAKELKDAQDKWDQKNSTTHHTSGVAKIDSKFIDGAPVGPGATSVPSDGSAGPGPDVSTVGPDGPGGDTSSADSEFTPGGADADGEVDTTAPGGLGEPSTEEPPAGQTPPEKGPEVQVTSPDGPDGDTSGGDSEFAPDGTDTDADNIDLDTTITSKELEGPDVDVVPPSLSNDKKIAEAQIVYRMQMNVAEGGYTDAQDLRRTLSILEQNYPGITDKVLTTNVTSYFKNKKQIDKDTAEKLETTEKPTYTPSSRPAEGTEVELDGITYRWLGKEAGKGGMWAVVKPDGTRGTTNHQNHSKLNDKANSTKSTLSKEDVSEIGFGEVDTTPANTQDSIKTAQDQVTPDLSPGPQANAKAQGDGAGQDNNPNAGDGGGTVTNNRPDALDLPGTSAPDSVTGSGRGDGQAELDARRQKAKDDKAKADAEADADNIDLDTTANTTQQGGRGTPPTAAQSAERAAMRKATAQAAANARIAQQKADKIKADAQAKVDAQNTASDAKLIARGKRIADQQAATKADAQNTASDAKLIARGKEIADQQATTKADAQNTASDAKLIALAKAFSDAAKDAKTNSQNQASDDKLIALAKAQADADRDAAIQARKQADLDAQQQAKDAQAQRDAEQAQRDADKEKADQTDANNIGLDTTVPTPVFKPNLGVVTPDKSKTKVTIGKDAKSQKNVTRTRDIDTRTGNTRKTVGSPRGVDKPDKKRNLTLHPFTPLSMPDPMNLSRYKSFGENINGKNNMKNLQEGYKIMPPMDPKYTERSGLEGPFTTLSGKVVYYDPKEGSYYDPDTDMYMSYDEFQNYDNDYSGMKDERDEVKETTPLSKLTRDQRDAISGTGKYKPKPAAPANGGRSSKPRLSGQPASLAMPDPMNLSRYKSFGDSTQDTRNPVNEEMSDEQIDAFHTALDTLVHKHLGHSSDEHAEVEETLSPDEKKQVNQMYNKDGTMTDIGNKVMRQGQVQDILKKAMKELKRIDAEVMFRTRDMQKAVATIEQGNIAGALQDLVNGVDGPEPQIQDVFNDAHDTLQRLINPKTDKELDDEYWADVDDMRARNRVGEEKTLQGVMSKVFDNALSEFEFNPRAGHRDQPSHPENRGLTPEYPEINVRPKARPASLAPKTSLRPKLRPANLQNRNAIDKAVQQAMGEGDGRKKGIHPKGHPMRSKQQAAIHANEGKMSDSVIVDSETMSKEEFAKKHGMEMANEYYESIAAQNVLDNSILAKENVDKLRKIVSDKSMMPIKFEDGTMKVDMTTANIFVKAFDKMKETNQVKVSEMIKTKAGFLRVMDIIYGAMK